MRPRARALTAVPPAPVIPVLVAARPPRHAAPVAEARRARAATELDLSDVSDVPDVSDVSDDGGAGARHEPWLHLGTPLLPPGPPALTGVAAARLWASLATQGCPRPALPGVGPSALELRPGSGHAEERAR